ncbi:MAG: hypothetical protein LBU42_03300 [Prevotellaceae bacterium]|jgi:hypothetical protein|nr:hypothetical protein [Prevotellaceae bacterium]
MANATVYWGDGTSDAITVTYSGTVGDAMMMVDSEPNNTLAARSRTLRLRNSAGVQMATLTVTQQVRAREYSADYNNDYK